MAILLLKPELRDWSENAHRPGLGITSARSSGLLRGGHTRLFLPPS